MLLRANISESNIYAIAIKMVVIVASYVFHLIDFFIEIYLSHIFCRFYSDESQCMYTLCTVIKNV